MTPQTIDTQQLKIALLQLLQSDKEFMQQLFQQTIINTEKEELEKMDSNHRRKQLREKYKRKGGIKMSVINGLQRLFEDAPSAVEMTNMLKK
jgi:hypothetical protein